MLGSWRVDGFFYFFFSPNLSILGVSFRSIFVFFCPFWFPINRPLPVEEGREREREGECVCLRANSQSPSQHKFRRAHLPSHIQTFQRSDFLLSQHHITCIHSLLLRPIHRFSFQKLSALNKRSRSSWSSWSRRHGITLTVSRGTVQSNPRVQSNSRKV